MIITLHNISPAKVYSRIVSLVPSQTELLHDLGLEEEVIGITKFCVHPTRWYKNKARIGGTKNVKIPSIHYLKPDLIIANKEENVKEQVEELAKNYDVFVTDVNNLTDALNMINDMGILVGKSKEAFQMANKIEAKFKKLQNLTSVKRKIKAAYLIWKDPFMAVGSLTFINDMMQYCGLENIFSFRDRYPKTATEEMRIDCELILLSSEPYPFKEKHLKEMALEIPGVRIILVDGEMFSWYGSRLLKTADYFKALQLKLADWSFGQLTG
jgi:ABC-type Fe3+-hydroxamate transport system substrate-binding protein